MSKVSVLSQVTVCPVCHKAYIPEIDICDCPETPEGTQLNKDEKNDKVDNRG